MAATEGVSKIFAKLQRLIDAGDYYEAHQLYRTLSFRYCTQKKYDKAVELLTSGAQVLLEAHQTSSGSDLALLLISIMEKESSPVSPNIIGKLAGLHRLIPEDNVDRVNYVTSALRWAEKTLSPAVASPASSSSPLEPSASVPTSYVATLLLHNEFGITYWNERNYARSRYHFIRSENGIGCATMLVEFHITYGYPSEVDMFVAQAVLQYLCLRNKMTAEACFNSYTTQHPQIETGPPFIRPLLNFLWLLLIAIEGGSLAVFNVLCEKYKTSLSRDPAYIDYLTRIGQLFFHLPIPKAPTSGGLFGGLFSNLLAMDDESDDSRLLDDHCPVELD